MFIVVDHTISDPAAFWAEANREKIRSLASDVQVLAVEERNAIGLPAAVPAHA
jgi:hypothetical protein